MGRYVVENPDVTRSGKRVWRRASILIFKNDSEAFQWFKKGAQSYYPYLQKRFRNVDTGKIIGRYGYKVNLKKIMEMPYERKKILLAKAVERC